MKHKYVWLYLLSLFIGTALMPSLARAQLSINTTLLDGTVLPCVSGTCTLPYAKVNIGYQATITATGGAAPYTWSASGLPSGLNIGGMHDSLYSGNIVGIATTVGIYPVTVTVTDDNGLTASQNFSLTTVNLLAITGRNEGLTAYKGACYAKNFATSGGTSTNTQKTWTFGNPPAPSQGGTLGLPNNVTQRATASTATCSGLASTTGANIAGIPTKAGSFYFLATVVESGTTPGAGCEATSSCQTASVEVSIDVGDPGALTLALTTSSNAPALPIAAPGKTYLKDIVAAGGSGNYTFAIVPGSILCGGALGDDVIVGNVGTNDNLGWLTLTNTTSAGASGTATAGTMVGRLGGTPPAVTAHPDLAHVNAEVCNFGVTVTDGTTTQTATQTLTMWVSDLTFDKSGFGSNCQGTPSGTGTLANSACVINGSLVAGTPVTPGSIILAAIGGAPGSHEWDLGEGGSVAIPPGLVLDPDTGNISGTPLMPGAYSFTAKLRDANHTLVTQNFRIGVINHTGEIIAVTGTSGGTLSAGSVATLTVGNGDARLLGNGTATPIVASGGTGNSGTTATDGTRTYTITTAASGALTMVTSSLATAQVGQPYSQGIVVTGGTPGYTFSATGNLPAGLSLTVPAGGGVASVDDVLAGDRWTRSSGILIAGTPLSTTGGPFGVNVTVNDDGGSTPVSTGALTLTVNSAASFSIASPAAGSLLGGVVGYGYGYNYSTPASTAAVVLNAAGGVEPYTWAVKSGSLPPGLQLTSSSNPNDGTGSARIQGTPTLAGSYSFSTTATDSASGTDTKAYTIQVDTLNLTITTGQALTGAAAGYTTTLAASCLNCTGSNNWTLAPGSVGLPGTLAITPATGVLAGAAPAGTYTFTVKVTNGTQTATKTFILTLS